MSRLSPFALGALALSAVLVAQQPDPYPGGGPPTSGTPGPRKGQVPQTGGGPPAPSLGKKKKNSVAGKPNLTVPTDSHQGLLVSIGNTKLVMLADDNRVVRYELSPAATYFRMNGKERKDAAAADIKPGDRVTVDSAKDEEGLIWAIQIVQQRPGTDQEKARVAGLSPTILQGRLEPLPDGEPDSDGRPRLRRSDANRKDGEKADTPKPAEQPKQAAEPTEPEHPDPPATVVVAQGTDSDKGDDNYGRAPKLKRGKPALTAPNRAPASAASQPEPVTKATLPSPAAASPIEWKEDPSGTRPEGEHPMLAKAREAIATLGEAMPNYICQQVTTRYMSTKRNKPDWQAEDIISADLVVENGHERYRNLQINFKPTKKSLDEIGGARSTGEFYTTLVDLFSSSTAADFRYSRPESIANRMAYVFNFKVTQPHSHWTVHHPSQSYRPAFKGSVWIDKETGNVLRIESQATQIPHEFPYDVIETTTDYDFVRIGGRQYIVPVKAENLSCEASTGYCARNLLEFKNYRKFAAESEILPSSEGEKK